MENLKLQADFIKFDMDETYQILMNLKIKEHTENYIHLAAKKTYKQMQILFWNNKELRTDNNFIQAQKFALETYLIAKNVHVTTGSRIKHFKKVYKQEQKNYQRIVKGKNEK